MARTAPAFPTLRATQLRELVGKTSCKVYFQQAASARADRAQAACRAFAFMIFVTPQRDSWCGVG